MCKMGISTLSSYHGAQIFEAHRHRPGRHRQVLHRHRVAARRHRARARSPRRRSCATRAASRRATRRATSTSAAYYALPRDRRAAPLEPADGRRAAEGGAPRGREVATRSTRGSSTSRATAPITLRGLLGLRARAARRCRSKRSRRRVDIVQALRHRRDELRQHLARRRTRTSPSR